MNLFEKIRPELLAEIKLFSEKNGISLFEKVRKETDILNLKSLLTEAHFGIYFDKIGSSLRYNNKIFKQNDLTPDFVFLMNSQEIIAEVCRINPTDEDMKTQEAEDKAIEEFKKENPNIPVMGAYHSITWKPEKLYGENGSMSTKANKYGPLVEQINAPILLCIYLDFISGHNNLDLNHSLYGSPAEFQGDFAFEEYFPGSPFHDLSKALFYKNAQMKRNVSGVLLRNNNGAFTYFHNFSSTNKLNDSNVKYFLEIQHPYE